MTEAKRILVVEDDEFLLDGMKRFLVACGHTVDSATNYLDGKDKLDSGSYDLIISDNRMPIGGAGTRLYEKAGLELLAYAAHNSSAHAETPKILYTGDDSDRYRQAAERFKITYLNKPSPHFADVVEMLLNKKAE